eukprot:8925283-Karenia_brevis.AAC.1
MSSGPRESHGGGSPSLEDMMEYAPEISIANLGIKRSFGFSVIQQSLKSPGDIHHSPIVGGDVS